ncbi:MAG: hypothetical protein EXR73_06950 [Myxococcales bacterium]|nr:hypothetical protein [Myxococcales bacterium]
MKDYPGKIRIVYKHYVVHPDTATTPALATCAAGRQGPGKFIEMKNAIFEKAYPTRAFTVPDMERLAAELGFDRRRFKADLGGTECAQEIADDQSALAKVGISGTPGFLINGRIVFGAQPIENFKKVIDEELAKAAVAIGAGVKPEDYYRVAVFAPGKRSQ